MTTFFELALYRLLWGNKVMQLLQRISSYPVIIMEIITKATILSFS